MSNIYELQELWGEELNERRSSQLDPAFAVFFFFQSFFLQLIRLQLIDFYTCDDLPNKEAKQMAKYKISQKLNCSLAGLEKKSRHVVQDEYCRFSSWANNFQRSLAQQTGVQSSHPPTKSLTKKCPGQGKCVSCSPKGPAGIQFFLSPAFLLPYNLKTGIQKPTELAQ